MIQGCCYERSRVSSSNNQCSELENLLHYKVPLLLTLFFIPKCKHYRIELIHILNSKGRIIVLDVCTSVCTSVCLKATGNKLFI